MLILRTERVAEKTWVDFGDAIPGLRLLCGPVDSAVVAEARHRSRTAAGAAKDADWDPGRIEGIGDAAYQTAIAQRVVADWEGVADESGAPVPISPAAIAAFMAVPALADLFAIRVLGPHQWLSAEKNACLPGQNGSGAEGENIAGAVPTPEPPAPAEGAA